MPKNLKRFVLNFIKSVALKGLLLKMCNKLPIIVVLGATGSGKTKLSIDLARKYNGEIIGADSMQVYKGLDIITAKVTKSEQELVPHHLIDFLEPQEVFTVLEYRNKALQVIDNLLSRNKVPIIVGGTNYYIESLIWKILVDTSASSLNVKPWELSTKEHKLSSEELYKKLSILDPNMAKRLHPKNKRKILRSLEVFYQEGKMHSEILKEQQTSIGASTTGGGLRFPNAIIFWLQCEQETLDIRLNDRVDQMIREGLINELENFHNQYNATRVLKDDPDYTKGVFQSIGFKEFHSYLMLNDELRSCSDGQKLFTQGVEQLKLVTRRYSKKQIKWINNRFLGRTDREVPPVYGLDTTNVNLWETSVYQPACQIIESYIYNSECEQKNLPQIKTCSTPNSEDDTFFCKTCNRVFIGSFQWSIHKRSRKHKKMVERTKKKD